MPIRLLTQHFSRAMWICSVECCQNASVRVTGDCFICGRHLCYKHVAPTFHTCPDLDDEKDYYPAYMQADQKEIEMISKKINYAALESHARDLRLGISCHAITLPLDRKTQYEVIGGMNVHIKVQFEDGVTWLARIRRTNATSPPPVVRDYIFRSEIATLRFLEKLNIPSPRIHGYALEGDVGNEVGVGYMFIEELPGTPLCWGDLTHGQTRKIVAQMADMAIEVSKHPMDSIGALHLPSPGTIGPIAREELCDLVNGNLRTLGPFTSMQDYWATYLQSILAQILDRQLYTLHPIDAYLIHRFLLDLVPQVWTAEKEPCYLKHADDKGSHILIDASANITGIIDWEWALFAPASFALNSPKALFHIQDFFAGETALSSSESYFVECLEGEGRADLAKVVREGKQSLFFDFCCAFDGRTDWEGWMGVFKGLRKCVGVDDGLNWDEWKQITLKRYENDDGVKQLLARGALTD
ncbi:hypothetical protein E4T38_09130 [Aureobasidium subglaciale]|nr:hypothetical protein E4T38_09130 [Aureobasidium subglaciale]